MSASQTTIKSILERRWTIAGRRSARLLVENWAQSFDDQFLQNIALSLTRLEHRTLFRAKCGDEQQVLDLVNQKMHAPMPPSAGIIARKMSVLQYWEHDKRQRLVVRIWPNSNVHLRRSGKENNDDF